VPAGIALAAGDDEFHRVADRRRRVNLAKAAERFGMSTHQRTSAIYLFTGLLLLSGTLFLCRCNHERNSPRRSTRDSPRFTTPTISNALERWACRILSTIKLARSMHFPDRASLSVANRDDSQRACANQNIPREPYWDHSSLSAAAASR
jgi:hypothetical protein